jgi:hypothetical protein
MAHNANQSLDHVLESAIVVSWADFAARDCFKYERPSQKKAQQPLRR